MIKLIENRMHHIKECPKDLGKKEEDGNGERQEEEEKNLKKDFFYWHPNLNCSIVKYLIEK